MEALVGQIEAYINTYRNIDAERKRMLRKIDIERKAREFAKPRVCDRIDDYSQEISDRLSAGAPEILKYIFNGEDPNLTL